MSDSEGSDWFDKDEDEILQDLQNKTKISADGNGIVVPDEYIRGGEATELRAAAAKSRPKKACFKISIDELRKISRLPAMEAFFFAATHEPDLSAAPVTPADGQDRIILYVHILAAVCSLELPGFHVDYLCSFAQNDAFAEHVRYLIDRLFSPRYKALWADARQVNQIISDLQKLLLQAHQAALLSPKWLETLDEIRRIVATNHGSAVEDQKLCLEFRRHLEHVLGAEEREVEPETAAEKCEEEKDSKSVEEGKKKQALQTEPEELLPTIDEFQSALKVSANNMSFKNPKKVVYETVSGYIAAQKRLIREDFMMPLRAYLRAISASNRLSRPWSIFMDDVRIILNKKFLEAHRNEMLFVDLFRGRRSDNDETAKESVRRELSRIKTGALLCFSTSIEFENLILATVAYTNEECLNEGYLGIEILRQYNIGNVYQQRLIMFQTPAFFEPYQNVYDFLSTCSVTNFPMNRYIVSGETSVKAPGYLKSDTTYKLSDANTNLSFKPLQKSSLPPDVFQLNDSQRAAFSSALTQEFCLIQGPPGTGKTHLSVHLVKTLIDNGPRKPLVLITYTNESLDKFLMKLTLHTNSIARFGNNSRRGELAAYNIREAVEKELVHPRLKRLYYITNLEYKTRFEHMQKLHKNFDGTEDSYQEILATQPALRHVARKLHTIRILFQYYVARQKDVIAMTTTCASRNNFLFRLLESPIVVFEEAAEISEAHVVACLTPYTQQVIMIGDHQQLQPFGRMAVSLFERLIKRNLEPSILNVQYRMHPAISNLICPLFYKQLFNAKDVVDKYPPVREMRKNLYFLNHNNPETKSELESSIYNAFEIEQICALAAHLICKGGYLPIDIVILSPYGRQVGRIRKMLLRHGKLQHIRAATVDSFQGLEAKIVLLTLVRSNTDDEIGFLNKTNRICVALSRAKHGMYIIGNMELLAKCNSKWRKISKKLREQNAIGGKFPFKKSEEEITEEENIDEEENKTPIQESEEDDDLNCIDTDDDNNDNDDNDEELLLNLFEEQLHKCQ